MLTSELFWNPAEAPTASQGLKVIFGIIAVHIYQYQVWRRSGSWVTRKYHKFAQIICLEYSLWNALASQVVFSGITSMPSVITLSSQRMCAFPATCTWRKYQNDLTQSTSLFSFHQCTMRNIRVFHFHCLVPPQIFAEVCEARYEDTLTETTTQHNLKDELRCVQLGSLRHNTQGSAQITGGLRPQKRSPPMQFQRTWKWCSKLGNVLDMLQHPF